MFKFKIGDFNITQKWKEPTHTTFMEWYREWMSLVDVGNLTINLVGGFSQKMLNPLHQTRDVDIILTGEVVDYVNLKKILNTAMELGFKHKLFIDISWVNTNVWNQHKAVRIGDEVDKTMEFSRIRTFYKTEKYENGKTSKVDFSDYFEVVELIEGLYQLNGYDSTTTDKVIKRMGSDIYKGIYMELNYVTKEIL
jgi:hypothetical protein